jgi:hypothetical protein
MTNDSLGVLEAPGDFQGAAFRPADLERVDDDEDQ